jgi:hypothetical protein
MASVDPTTSAKSTVTYFLSPTRLFREVRMRSASAFSSAGFKRASTLVPHWTQNHALAGRSVLSH